MVWLGESFYCRFEREYSQRHLEKSRADRESSKSFMSSRLDGTLEGESGRVRDEDREHGGRRRREGAKRESKRHS